MVTWCDMFGLLRAASEVNSRLRITLSQIPPRTVHESHFEISTVLDMYIVYYKSDALEFEEVTYNSCYEEHERNIKI